MRTRFWSYHVDPYDIFLCLLNNPRIPKSEIARRFNVNHKTGNKWFEAAIKQQIIRLPIFRRKSFFNFREYFYFLNVKDPHELYVEMQSNLEGIMFYSVQTGFSNFQIVSAKKMTPPGKVVLSGERSDYHVTIPPNCTFETSISSIEKKLSTLSTVNSSPSPLVYHDEIFEEWDDLAEQIYQKLYNSFRRPIKEILRTTDAYSDKIIKWLRNRDRFGHTIIMYFPEGLAAYQPTTYCIETEYDSLLIDLFSWLPVSTIFYRLNRKMIMNVFLPFNVEAKQLIRRILSVLGKKELVADYTNSIDEYGYRP